MIALAKAEDRELTKAEAYMAEPGDLDLDRRTLKKAAGGKACYEVSPSECDCYWHS